MEPKGLHHNHKAPWYSILCYKQANFKYHSNFLFSQGFRVFSFTNWECCSKDGQWHLAVLYPHWGPFVCASMGPQPIRNGYSWNTREFSLDICYRIKQIIHNVNLINFSCCVGSNKRQSWSRETHHTAFLCGWNSNEFPTASKTCSYVKHQFSGKKKLDNQSLLHLEMASLISYAYYSYYGFFWMTYFHLCNFIFIKLKLRYW